MAAAIIYPQTPSGVGVCDSCGEEYGAGCAVDASKRAGVCASCDEAMDAAGGGQ